MPSIFQRISHCLGGQSRRESVADRSEEGAALHQELGRWTSALAPCPPAPAGLRSPAHLNQETLLDKALPHASRLSDGTVLMASPHLDEALRFAYACVEHRIDRVVDLRSAKEKQRGHACPLDGGRSAFGKDHGIARFARQGRERPLNGAGKGDPEDHVRTVHVSLKPGRKTPVPAGGKPRDLSRSLEWIRVHVGSGKAIEPQRLLDVSLHLARTAPDGRTAFQCADGQHTGATFAAAHALLQAHLRDPIPADDLKETLMDVCLSIRRDRGLELFRAEDLAALMAFGRLMLDQDRRGALQDLPRSTMPAVPAAPVGSSTPATAHLRAPLQREIAPLPEETLPLAELTPPLVEIPSRPPTARALQRQEPLSLQAPLRPTLATPDAARRETRSILKKAGEPSNRERKPVSFKEGHDVRRFYGELAITKDFALTGAQTARAGKAARTADVGSPREGGKPKLSAFAQLFGEPRPTTTDH
jgi:hypothetical protein